jgi:hypothetical protein
LGKKLRTVKQAVIAFLKRRNVPEVNRYGWVLLRAIFGDKWKPGKGKDQVAAFRAIPRPFNWEDNDPKKRPDRDGRAKAEWFRMLQKSEK